MSKDILYTKHAEDMVKLRKINKELVDEALSDPDEIINQNETKINHKIIGDNAEGCLQREWKFLYR